MTAIKLIFYSIYKKFYNPLSRLFGEKIRPYNEIAKLYYGYKMDIFTKWYNFIKKKSVKRYFKLHTDKATMVIYTCLTGGYDNLLIPGFINSECDYICFTDDKDMIEKKYIGPWKIEPLYFSKLNDSRNNRWHKMHPHILFPNYESSIYIDSNVNFKTGKIFEYIKEIPTDCCIALSHHPSRDCLYDEAKFVIEAGYEDAEKVEQLIQKYKSEGFPQHFGLAENNIIFRRHNTAISIKLMEDWWKIFSEYLRRDQLGLFYLLWRDKVNFSFFAPTSFKKDHKNFRIYKHRK